jgi:hypothetical protein
MPKSLPDFLAFPAIITGALSLFLLQGTFKTVYSAFSDEDAFLGPLVKVGGPLFILILIGLLLSSVAILFCLGRNKFKKCQKTKMKAEQDAAANP